MRPHTRVSMASVVYSVSGSPTDRKMTSTAPTIVPRTPACNATRVRLRQMRLKMAYGCTDTRPANENEEKRQSGGGDRVNNNAQHTHSRGKQDGGNNSNRYSRHGDPMKMVSHTTCVFVVKPSRE